MKSQFLGNQSLNGTGGAIDYVADTIIFGRNLTFDLSKSNFIENSSSANNGAICIVTQAELGSTVKVNYCTIENGVDSIYVSDPSSVLNWGTGKLTGDP